MYALTPFATDRLRAQVPGVVARAVDTLARQRGLDLDGQRPAVIQAATAALMDGIQTDGLAAEAVQAVLEQARSVANPDCLLDLLLLHRLGAGLERELPSHVTRSIAALGRMTARRGRRRGRGW
jgi:hypothetical protein